MIDKIYQSMNGVPAQMRILIPRIYVRLKKQTLALQIRNMVATSTNGQQYQQPFEKLQVVTSTNGHNTNNHSGSSLQTHSPPGTHFLACGLPNPSLFPFKEAKLTLKSGETITLDGKLIDDAQQYTETTGYSPLVKQVKELVVRYHNPPNLDNSDFIITIGAQDGFTRAMSLLLSPGDFVITENPTFTGMLSAFQCKQVIEPPAVSR
ncbi:Kynurenine/alpha-aminoadipate aminotransferase, mitochondrial [Armadillidium vulgare]|nr:Kynurenine/alpha-aminoadipate aminotransferase, mitochondrial [Armadillidium vulgare]